MKKTTLFILLILIALNTPIEASAQTMQRFTPTNGSQRSSLLNSTNITNTVSTVVGCTDLGNKIIKSLTKLALKSSSKILKGAIKGVAGFFGLGKAADSLLEKEEQSVKDEEARAKQEQLRKKEYCYDRIAYTLTQAALSQLSNKTLNWVNTGFGGNPFYVRDIDSFLTSIKNEKVRDYIRIADNINSGDGTAVGNNVTNKIIEMVTGRSVPSVGPSTASELKYDSFTKDFSSGGWDSWYGMTQLGENPIGEVLTVSQQLGKNIGQQQDYVQKEIAQGDGFLSQKQCAEWAKIDPDEEYSGQNPDGSPKCLKYETVTPGTVIAEQTKQITGSLARQLEAADEMNEVLSKFFSGLINNLFNKGLQSLGTASNQDFGSFGNNDLTGFSGTGSNLVYDSLGQPVNGTGTSVLPVYDSSASGYDTGDFNISNPKHIAQVIKIQKDFLSQTLDSQAAIRKVIPNLGQLDYCLPGPNLSWSEGIQQNIPVSQTAFSSIRFAPAGTVGSFETSPYTLSGHIVNRTKNFPEKTFFIMNITRNNVGASVNEKFAEWLTSFETNMDDAFGLQALSTAFENLESTIAGKTFARGFVKDALLETATLPDYVEAISENDTIYTENIAELENNIPELEDIRAEVLSIITTARNRHIAAKQAQGITVNMACLNEAYDISNSVINGKTREESDPTALLNAMESAQTSFYNNL
jgi:hypothetical protein